MRIIAGTAKGRRIQAPKGELTRPTLDRVKESLFSILQFSLPGAAVLDLYAGSGNLGLEALSRGAKSAAFNDHSRQCCALIRENIKTLGFSARAEVLQLDALAAIHHLAGRQLLFDIAFLDPPYRQGADEALTLLFQENLMREGGVAVAEHDWDAPPQPDCAFATLKDRRRYGGTGLSFFERTTLI